METTVEPWDDKGCTEGLALFYARFSPSLGPSNPPIR